MGNPIASIVNRIGPRVVRTLIGRSPVRSIAVWIWLISRLRPNDPAMSSSRIKPPLLDLADAPANSGRARAIRIRRSPFGRGSRRHRRPTGPHRLTSNGNTGTRASWATLGSSSTSAGTSTAWSSPSSTHRGCCSSDSSVLTPTTIGSTWRRCSDGNQTSTKCEGAQDRSGRGRGALGREGRQLGARSARRAGDLDRSLRGKARADPTAGSNEASQLSSRAARQGYRRRSQSKMKRAT